MNSFQQQFDGNIDMTNGTVVINEQIYKGIQYAARDQLKQEILKITLARCQCCTPGGVKEYMELIRENIQNL